MNAQRSSEALAPTAATRPRPAPRRLAWLLAAGLGVALGTSSACDLIGECNGDVEVSCDEEGCACASGPAKGESCSEEVEPDHPDACEVVCCDE